MSDFKANAVAKIRRLGARILGLARERDRYQEALDQIAIVCTDNMDRDCNHRMALDFVRRIANDATSQIRG